MNSSSIESVSHSVPDMIEDRIRSFRWNDLRGELDAQGCAIMPGLLTLEECRGIADLYPQDEHFRSHIHMARHGFGKGEYRYFKYPLPDLIGSLRTSLYPRLAVAANAWNERMGGERHYPAKHADFLEECHIAGQMRPTVDAG